MTNDFHQIYKEHLWQSSKIYCQNVGRNETGCSFLDQYTLSLINPKYDDWFASDLRRLTQIVLRKSDENYSSYFGFLGDKICWSDKEQPVVHENLDGREMKQAVKGCSFWDQHILSTINPK